MVKIGVVSIQGAVSEHVEAMQRAMTAQGIDGEVAQVRHPPHLENVDAILLPGGESTTISKLLVQFGLYDAIKARALEGMPVMGTCAGCILLAKEGDEEVHKTGTKLLGLMDMAVVRNAFGRQKESFQAKLDVEGIGEYQAVFIRAPAITRVWGDCKPLATIDDKIVAARQGNLIALAFHPELTGDTKFHEMLVGMLKDK